MVRAAIPPRLSVVAVIGETFDRKRSSTFSGHAASCGNALLARGHDAEPAWMCGAWRGRLR